MKPALDWLSDPEIFAVNKEKAHSDHIVSTKNGNLRQDLNGTWKFHYCEYPAKRPADFFQDDYDVSGFDSIAVPYTCYLWTRSK